MDLQYIQRKSAVSSILWLLGCGLGMTHYPVSRVYAGFDLGDTVWLCRKKEGFLCGDQGTHIEKLVADFQDYVIKHPHHAAAVKKIYLRRAKELDRFIRDRLAVRDYSQSSNRELWLDYRRVSRAYRDVYTYGEPFAIAIGNLSDRIKDGFIRAGLTDGQFERMLLPTELSFIQREQKEFLAIALKNKGRVITATTVKRLRDHYNRYTWLPYDYGVTTYSLRYFNAQLKTALKKPREEIKSKYQAINSYSRALDREQKALARKFHLSARQRSWLDVIRTAFYLVDAKKELFTRCHWYSERLFVAIAARVGVPSHLLKYALPEEVRGFLKGKPAKPKSLQGRYDNCFLRIKSDGAVTIFSGLRAKAVIDKFLASRNRAIRAADVKGRTANLGLARGKARIILDARRCQSFQHGEILVTAMTSPDYMLAARRAAAIITDEGSITCHAAIISRELGIPCIVSTKIATKVIRTGDLVEVDANRGLVKVIKDE